MTASPTPAASTSGAEPANLLAGNGGAGSGVSGEVHEPSNFDGTGKGIVNLPLNFQGAIFSFGCEIHHPGMEEGGGLVVPD